MKVIRSRFLLVVMLLSISTPTWADWMVISYSGEKPNRTALFAHIDSLSSSSDDLERASAMFRNDGAEMARIAERTRRYKSVRLVQIFENADQPESRYHSIEFDQDLGTFRTLDSCEFRRNGTFVDLTSAEWQPVGANSWSPLAYRFVFEQALWREGMAKLLERTRREKKVTEQRELASMGYELVHNHTDLEFPDLLWRYVWTDGQKPLGEDSDLTVAKIQYGLRLDAKENIARQKVLTDVQSQVQRTIAEKKRLNGDVSGDSVLPSWIGGTETDLVGQWGSPDSFSERDGVRYLTYRKERVVDILGNAPSGSGLSVTKVGEEILWAEVTFLVVEGGITEYTTDGNAPW